MQEIDVLLDNQPHLAYDMIICDIRNRQAHAELQAYNDHKTFVLKHPFLTEKRQYDNAMAELLTLKQTNPSAFINECHSITKNLNRYTKSLSNNKFSSEEEKERVMDNIHRYEMRKSIVEIILKE